MLPLIKIRMQYMKRHPCALFVNYFCLGCIILIILFFYIYATIRYGPIRKLENHPESQSNKIFEYPIEVGGLDALHIVSDNETIKLFKNFFKNKTEYKNISYYNKIKDVVYKRKDLTQFIILEVIKKNNFYNFKMKSNKLYMKDSIDDAESTLIQVHSTRNIILSEISYIMNEFLLNITNTTKPKKKLKIYSYPIYNGNQYINEVSYFIAYPIFITIEYGLIFLSFSVRMIDEKEKKLDILLSRYGIKKYQYFLSWLLTYFVLTGFTTICTIITFCYIVLARFDFFILLFILTHIIFSFGIFAMSFFLQTMISKIKTGQTLFKLLFIGISILGIPIVTFDTPKIIKILFCIFPHISMTENLQLLLILHNLKKINKLDYFSTYKKFNFVETTIYLIFDALFFSVGGFFILSYKESGLNFISFLFSPFVKVSRYINENKQSDEIFDFNYSHEELSQRNKDYKERRNFLEIKNVTKIYDDLIAVNNFCGELFPNEIFCLLGHNGAGKTTLIKMISGNEDPDEGDIFLNNISLVTNKKYLYENIGLCSQDDIFFDHLTVEEHLKYMAEIKGNKANMNEIDDLLNKIELQSKKNALCKTLSGGQKRKLCIALALIGNSQLVLLDEPTSGLDVIAKKALWVFLKNYKKDKIIILTTHSLDEAEYLGDRIGIMSEGHFLCSGSSSYLKDKYPCGYNINLIMNPKVYDNEKKNLFLNEIKNIYPSIIIKISSKSLLSISCEKIDERTNEIFNYIEKIKDEIGIEDYTIATTSLEDVFLKLNINDRTKNMDENELGKGLEIQDNPEDLHSEASTFCVQFSENIKRNFYPLWRSKSNFIIELLSSLSFLILFIIIYQTFVENDYSKYINFNRLLKANKIVVDNQTKEYLENSALVKESKLKINYDLLSFSPKYEYNITYTLEKFSKNFFKWSKTNGNEKVAVFKHENETSVHFFLLFQNGNFLYNNIMNTLCSSAYYKSLGLDVILFNEYSNLKDEISVSDDKKMILSIYGIIITIFSLISFSGFILNPIVKEKETNVKHLLYLSGADMLSYYLGFFVIDLLKFFILLLCCFSIMIFFDYYYFLILLPVFIFFCFTINIFLYVYAFLISREEQAQKSYYILIFSILILTPIIFVFILSFFENPTYREFFQRLLKYFFMPYFITPAELTPITSLILAVVRISFSFFYYKLEMSSFYDDLMPKPLVLIITHCIYFLVQFIIWGLILYLLQIGYLLQIWIKFEKTFCIKNKSYKFSTEVPINDGYIIQNKLPEKKLNDGNLTTINNNINNNFVSTTPETNNNEINNEVNDNNINSINEPLLNSIDVGNNNNDKNLNSFVKEQKSKVENNVNLTTKISGLRKTFCFCCKTNLRAVNDLYLGLEGNEKFGLLGFNGSGKSTTFKCITNEIYYDKGDISLFGFDTKKSFDKIRKMIGYCPQENPLFEYLTVRELLKFYKSLKKSNVSVEDICKKFGIERYIDKYCIDLSGGNKRKLTFAISLMNYPKILLLDEPSTGVDPESRRIMWKNINELSSTGNKYNMILTTHSMEEAEILCDTVSWLKSGNFICVGNPEKLKILYSAGYKLHIKFKDDKIKELKNNENNPHYNLCDLHIEGASYVMGFYNQTSDLVFYCDAFYQLIKLISDKCDKISIKEIGRDFSFDVHIQVKREKQGLLFSQILNMKNNNEMLGEISINMESLENILTNL